MGIVVALWPPDCLASALELVALVASPANKQPIVTNATPAEWAANAPVDAWLRSVDGEVMDCCGRPDESWLATAARDGRGADLGCCCRTPYHILARDSALYGARSRQMGSSTCIAPGAACVLTRSAGRRVVVARFIRGFRTPDPCPLPARARARAGPETSRRSGAGGAVTCPCSFVPAGTAARARAWPLFRAQRVPCATGCSLWVPVSCPASLVSGARAPVGHGRARDRSSRQAECPW